MDAVAVYPAGLDLEDKDHDAAAAGSSS
jgi:hypothetical protein